MRFSFLISIIVAGFLWAPTVALAQAESSATLPTDRPFSLWWENVFFRIQLTFTRSLEHRADLLERRLMRLDQQAETCLERANEDCLHKIEERRQAVEERTKQFIERRQEQKEQLMLRFENLRQEHQERRQAIRRKIQQRALPEDLPENTLPKTPLLRSDAPTTDIDQSRDEIINGRRVKERLIKKEMHKNGSSAKVEIRQRTEANESASIEDNVNVNINVE